MALGYGPVLAGMMSPNPSPPGGMGGHIGPPLPPISPPPGSQGYGGLPAGSSPPFRIGGQYGFPPWLQAKVDAFNAMHNQAVASGTRATPVPGGSGYGMQLGTHRPPWLVGGPTNTGGGPPGGPPPTGPPGPPVQPPPDWQSYWEQWYRSRQPYADWLSGYVHGAY